MNAFSIWRRLRRRLAGERGMALPTAIFATIASLGLASVAAMSSVEVQRGSGRDNNVKSAIAAADAGANVALMRLNRDSGELAEDPCLDGATPSDGWCPPVTETVGEAEYTYRISEAGGACREFDLCVVATGTAGASSRRVLVSFNASTSGVGEEGSEEEGEDGGGGGTSGDVSAGLIGEEEIELSGNADIRVGVGTNGNLVSSGNTSICGDIRHGIGEGWIKSGNTFQCSGNEIVEENETLPPVSNFLPEDIATNNSNARITTCEGGEPPECQADTFSGKWRSDKPFDPDTRAIDVSANDTLTLGGGDYWICSLTLSGNSELIMADGAQVRLFFDTPENCGGTTNQISLSGNNRISATGYQPEDGQFDMPGFYLLGSESVTSQVNLSGNYSTTNELIVYGPDTHVNISGNATFKGLVAGKRVTMSGNGKFEQDAGFDLPPGLDPWESESSEEEDTEGTGGGGDPIFTPQFYVQCSGAEGPTPDANC